MKINQYLAIFLLLCAGLSRAQYTVITPGNDQPNIESVTADGGVLVPKISLSSNLSVSTPVLAPQEGMLVYNTGALQTKGFYYWTGGAWAFLGVVIPDLSANLPIVIQSNTVKLNAGTTPGQLITWDNVNWVNTNPKPPAAINNLQPYLALNYCISLFGVFPSQNGSDPFIGDIAIFGFNFEPVGWAYCNGQLLNIYDYDALFALIGTTYGGDGQNTFGLPDLRGRVPIHKGQGSGLSPYLLGQQAGNETTIINDKY